MPQSFGNSPKSIKTKEIDKTQTKLVLAFEEFEPSDATTFHGSYFWDTMAVLYKFAFHDKFYEKLNKQKSIYFNSSWEILSAKKFGNLEVLENTFQL